MKFTKYNNPNKRKHTKRINKNEYLPTLQELNYCDTMKISPNNYVNIKFNKQV